MSQYESGQWDSEQRGMTVDVRRLWAGAAATALVAAGVGVAGVLAIRGLLGIPILGTRGDVLVNEAILVVPLAAAFAALLATALLQLLVLSTPRPTLFFGSICSVVILVLVLLVFSGSGSLDEQVATSLLYLAIGVVIVSLLSGVAHVAIRPAGPPRYRPGSSDQTQVMRRNYPDGP